ncbi:putative Ferritin-like superfamily [Dioscorea sansibarensis]
MKRGRLMPAGQTNGIPSTMFAVRRFQSQHRHRPFIVRPRTFNFIAPFHSQSHHRTPHHFWPDLQRWRDAPHNHARSWGSDGPSIASTASYSVADDDDPMASASCLADCARIVLSTPDPLAKSRLSHLAFSRWRRHGLPVGISHPPDRPARPPKPVLVSPKEIPSHKELGLPLNAYMLHNLAHVELNAIDLAWDTVVRFSAFQEELGDDFFWDFARVADDESRHFSWCSQRLAELGFNYGDIPAHNLLWRECEKSSGDVSARLAMIPMVQEARGLDAGPRLVQKLVGFGDHRTSNIVAKIAEEEVAHVAVGVYWFVLVCQKMGRVPCATFKDILKEYNVELKGPFNYTAREEAGIPRDWYDGINTIERKRELAEVHDRLACIVAMEKENSSLNS